MKVVVNPPKADKILRRDLKPGTLFTIAGNPNGIYLAVKTYQGITINGYLGFDPGCPSIAIEKGSYHGTLFLTIPDEPVTIVGSLNLEL